MKYQIQYREAVDSTNLWAKELAFSGAEEGTVTVADMQSDGRGRRGRTWDSPAGTAIYMSLLLRPEIRPEQAPMITLVMGLAVVQVCRRLLGTDAYIKWPNDMVIRGKKVCGILTEMNVSADGIGAVIVGVGINVNQQQFPEEIADTATSLLLETGRRLDREALRDDILSLFEEYYAVFLQTGDLSGLMNIYNQVLINRGKSVRVLDPSGEYNGVSGGINEKGELLVTKEDGTCIAIYAGEVSVRGVYGYV